MRTNLSGEDVPLQQVLVRKRRGYQRVHHLWKRCLPEGSAPFRLQVQNAVLGSGPACPRPLTTSPTPSTTCAGSARCLRLPGGTGGGVIRWLVTGWGPRLNEFMKLSPP